MYKSGKDFIQDAEKIVRGISPDYSLIKSKYDDGSFGNAIAEFRLHQGGVRFISDRGQLFVDVFATPGEWISLNVDDDKISSLRQYEKILSQYINDAFEVEKRKDRGIELD